MNVLTEYLRCQATVKQDTLEIGRWRMTVTEVRATASTGTEVFDDPAAAKDLLKEALIFWKRCQDERRTCKDQIRELRSEGGASSSTTVDVRSRLAEVTSKRESKR